MSHNKCGCDNTPPCTTDTTCTCPVFLTSDCTNNVTEDMPYMGILAGKTLNGWMLAVDAFLSEKFASIQGFFTLKNVGIGVGKIYKGISILGEKEIKSVKGTSLIDVNNLTDEVEVAINETALSDFIDDNQSTYSATNVGTGVEVYKDSTVLLNNTQFNFKTLKSSDSSVIITEGVDDIDLTASVSSEQNFQEVTDVGYITDNLFYKEHDYGEGDGILGIVPFPAVPGTDETYDYPVNGVISGFNEGDSTSYSILGFNSQNVSRVELPSINFVTTDYHTYPNRNLKFEFPLKDNPSYPVKDTYTLATVNYKVYTAIIRYNGVSWTPSILENSVGAIVWSGDANNLTGTLTGAFTTDKTFILTTTYNDEGSNNLTVSSRTVNAITLYDQEAVLDQENFVEIRVYN